MFVDSPVSSIVSEIGNDEVGSGLDAVAEDSDSVEAEADDVSRAYAASRDWEGWEGRMKSVSVEFYSYRGYRR